MMVLLFSRLNGVCVEFYSVSAKHVPRKHSDAGAGADQGLAARFQAVSQVMETGRKWKSLRRRWSMSLRWPAP